MTRTPRTTMTSVKDDLLPSDFAVHLHSDETFDDEWVDWLITVHLADCDGEDIQLLVENAIFSLDN